MKNLNAQINFRELGKNGFPGLQVHWVSGTHKKKKINISCGAGVGNPNLTLQYGDKTFIMDIKDICKSMIKGIEEFKPTLSTVRPRNQRQPTKPPR